MITRNVQRWCDRFDRAQALTTTPGQNGWTVADTSSSGTPTYLTTADGLKLTLASTSEAEIVTAYQNDVLAFPIDKIQSVSFIAKVAAVDAVTTLVMGLATGQNDTSDSVTNLAWFRLEGSVSTSAIVAETDDGSLDNDDVSTSTSLAAVFKKFTIDFEAGLSNVKFYIDGERVAGATTFDMSNVTSGQGVQPYFQIQKASGTGVPSVTVREVEIVYNTADGA